jgi:hypothetical protein
MATLGAGNELQFAKFEIWEADGFIAPRLPAFTFVRFE